MKFPILYEQNETDFFNLGLGPLTNTIKATVPEERNGAFYFEGEVLIDSPQFKLLKNDRIIKANAGHTLKDQRFRIKRIVDKHDGTASIYAEHVSYLSQELSLIPEMKVFNRNGQGALDKWSDSVIDEHPFVVDSDIETVSSTEWIIGEVNNARDALGGVEGSILSRWGGEYRFDNYHISLLKKRGKPAETLLAYGRNITDFEQERNITNTYTSVFPYARYTDNNQKEHLVTVDGYIVDSEYVANYPNRKALPIDFSSEFEHEDVPTKKALLKLAEDYIKNNDIGIPKTSIKVSFLDLSKTADYAEIAPLEQLSLCDDVRVEYPLLGVSTVSKVVRTVWNVLTESYDEIEIGEKRASLSSKITEQEKAIKEIENNSNGALIAANGKNTVFYGLFGEDGLGEPVATMVGDMWYKPNGEDTELYIWNGTVWEFIMSTKDNKAIEQAITDLEQISKENIAKSDQALLDAESARNEAKTAREEAFNSGIIAKNAEKDALNALAKGDSNTTKITSLEGQQKLTNTKVEGNTANILNLQTDSEKLSLSIGKVQADVENINVGDGNDFPKSERERSSVPTGREFINVLDWDMAPLIDSYGIDREYTLSVDIKATVPGKIKVYSQNGSSTRYSIGYHDVNVTTEYQRFYFVFKPNKSDMNDPRATLAFYGTYGTGVFPIVRKGMFTIGNVRKEWQISARDLTSKSEFATFEANYKGFQQTVSSDITGLQSQQTQMDGQITRTVEKLDNLQIGTRNYWAISKIVGNYYINGIGEKVSWPHSNLIEELTPLESGEKLILQYWNPTGGIPPGPNGRIHFYDIDKKFINQTAQLKVTTNSYNVYYVTPPSNAKYFNMNTPVHNSQFRVKIEKGNKATDWSPAPEDNASKSEVIQLSDQITQTVNKVETVDNKVTSQQSQITQLSTDINLKADKDNVISQINLSSEQILIDSKLIHLSGQSLIDDAVIKSAMIDSIVANKITTGELNAANVNIINMNANNITTGFLSGNRIESRTIRADHLQANTIELALEEMGRAVKITPMNIKIFNTDSEVEYMRLDTFGLQVARTEGNKLGIIGRNNKPGYPDVQGLTFGLEHRGQFMSWTAKYAIDDPYYTDQMILDPRGAYAGVSGLHLETRFRPKKGGTVTGGDWQWYVDSNYNKHTIAYARLANGYIAEDFYFEKGNSLQSYRNIHMNGYNITGSSGYSLKENFEYMNERDSLNAILSTDIVGYNYIENPDTFNVGFVINDNGQSPYYTDERLIRSKKYKDDSLLVGHLMLAVKALNEKIEILEERIEYAR